MTELTAAEVKDALKRGIKLMDVRQPEEFADRFIKGAVNIPLGAMFLELMEMLHVKDQKFMLCGSEVEVKEAWQTCSAEGYENLEGVYTRGIEHWEAEGNEIDLVIITDANELRIDAYFGKVELIDVRPEDDFGSGSIERSHNLPLSRIWEEKNLKEDYNTVIYVYGNSDEECMTAISYLKLEGFKNLYFVEGGYEAVKGQQVKFSDS